MELHKELQVEMQRLFANLDLLEEALNRVLPSTREMEQEITDLKLEILKMAVSARDMEFISADDPYLTKALTATEETQIEMLERTLLQ